MISLYKDNDKLIKSTLKQIYDKTLEVSISHSIVPVKKKIDPTKVIEREVAGRIWTERTKHYGNNFVYDVHSIIKEGLSRGDTYTTMAKNLENRFGKDIGNTVRIARTEGARVLEDTKFQTFEEINKNPNLKVIKVWHTMSDERVRDTHQAMEGVEVDFDEEFTLPSGATCMYPKSSGLPSEDINCRCYCEYKTVVISDDLGYNIDDIIVPKSLSAAAFRDAVKLPDGTYTKTTEGTKITKVVVFAGGKTNKKVKVAPYLAKQYNNNPKDWRKVRGEGFVDVDKTSRRCELHWFESKQTGRIKMKVKRWFDDES